ncbi:MAG: hypothetical protein LQ340_003618 [Diploschistes diacapsis]|nr:MAG: hypothetical protein LQ340_003618 [Diploschistes diacapsis]
MASRGTWSTTLDMQLREYILTKESEEESSRDYLVAWLQEQAVLKTFECTRNRSVLSLLFNLACRDTRECLLHIRERTIQMESATFYDDVVQENFGRWRWWLNKSQAVLRDVEQQLSQFVNSYGSDARGVISPTKRWTSHSQSHQLPHPCPVHLFFRGFALKGEVATVQRMLREIQAEMKTTVSAVEHTNESIRTTMSLLESRRAISEAESVTKLTEFAFLFIPVSFAASFFSMPLDVSQS